MATFRVRAETCDIAVFARAPIAGEAKTRLVRMLTTLPDPTDLAGDPEASPANPMFSMVSQPGVGEYPVASTPFDFSDFGRATAPAPPRLGEHTEAVLSEILGMSKDAIRDLRTQGIAG